MKRFIATSKRSIVTIASSTLTNGLRVSTLNSPAEFDAAALYIRTAHLPVALQPLALAYEKILFKGNTQVPEKEILKQLDGIIGANHGRVRREGVLVGGAVAPEHLEKVLRLLRDVTRGSPVCDSDQLESIKQAIKYDLFELKKKTDLLLPELAISAAYQRGPSCVNSVEDLSVDNLSKFYSEACLPENMDIMTCTVNGNHSELIGLVNELFVFSEAAAPGTNGSDSAPRTNQATAEKVLFNEQDKIEVLNDEESQLTHLGIAFPGLPKGHKDSHILAVLERLLGGGGSFSAGGPGKGMYSRMYTQVLNRYYWMESAKAFSSHTFGGLFGVHGSAAPGYARELAHILIDALKAIPLKRILEKELLRAKAQVKSAQLMDSESRVLLLEDACLQVQYTGTYQSPEEYSLLLDKVTEEDVQRVAGNILTCKKPAIVAYGQTDRLPSYESISSFL